MSNKNNYRIHVTTIALQMSKINQDQSYNTLRKPRDNLGKLVTLGTQDTGRRQTTQNKQNTIQHNTEN